MNKKIKTNCSRCGEEFEIWNTHKNRNSRCPNCRKDKGTRLYRIWENMKTRCNNEKSPSFQVYGAKGTTVCEDWNEFQSFKKWALNNGYNDNLTLERINYNGNYEPSNCKWATHSEQSRNKRNTVNITINNKTMCLKDWCAYLNLSYKNIHSKLKRLNMTAEQYLLREMNKLEGDK